MNHQSSQETIRQPTPQLRWPALRYALRLVWIAVLLVLLVGCSLPGKAQAPAPHTYVLKASGPADAAAVAGAGSCLSLRVSAPLSAPGFATSKMAYSTQPPQLDYFAYHQWVDAPASMIAAMMEARLDANGLFSAVLAGSTDIRTDLRLDSELKTLLQNIDGNNSSVELTIKLGLVDVSSRSLLDTRVFRYTETAAGANPVAGAAAANRAANRFLADLTPFVAGAVSHFDCPGVGSGPAVNP